MNKEEYIIKMNDNEISVSKELYYTLVPFGKIINKLEQENKQLKHNLEIQNKTNELLDKENQELFNKMQELESGDSNE